ncbi:proline-rich transmembrane protein 3-like [Acanthaster planci]|uniref:Proline-rich transmembrane protein 3-like n=1 Tax=Acanthaster planci TaxID=133434 RepID=A0A8B7Y049_ACAPL|nr:proline-rich transmembrane protein 3-like [Acanthaster planci]
MMDSVNFSITTEAAECSNQTKVSATTAASPAAGPRCRWPAPTPNWTAAFEEWQWAWPAHIYLFPTLYLCLSIYIIVWFVTGCSKGSARENAEYRGNRKTPRLNSTLHGLVLVSCVTRCIFLYADPYGTRKVLPCPLGPVLWSCGWPFITASVSVLLLVLLETTKMSLAPPKFQKPGVLAAIVVPSLCFVFVADFLVAYDNSTKYALLVCQAMFILWGCLLGIGFLVVAWKMRHIVANSQGCVTSQEVGVQESGRLKRLNDIVLACSVIALALTSINLYAVVSIYVSHFRSGYTAPWRWMIFQTCQRLLEVSIVIVILLAVQGTDKQ